MNVLQGLTFYLTMLSLVSIFVAPVVGIVLLVRERRRGAMIAFIACPVLLVVALGFGIVSTVLNASESNDSTVNSELNETDPATGLPLD